MWIWCCRPVVLKLESERWWPEGVWESLPGDGKGECTWKCLKPTHQKPLEAVSLDFLPAWAELQQWLGREMCWAPLDREGKDEPDDWGWREMCEIRLNWPLLGLGGPKEVVAPDTSFTSQRAGLVVLLLFPRTWALWSRSRTKLSWLLNLGCVWEEYILGRNEDTWEKLTITG